LAATLLLTFVAGLLAVMALLALVPVVFAEPATRAGFRHDHLRPRTGAGCAGTISQCPIPDRGYGSRYRDGFIGTAVLIDALHVLVIVWNNAAALRISENLLAQSADEVAASRTRLISAADDERPPDRAVGRSANSSLDQYPLVDLVAAR
jgi:hypothetical protein